VSDAAIHLDLSKITPKAHNRKAFWGSPNEASDRKKCGISVSIEIAGSGDTVACGAASRHRGVRRSSCNGLDDRQLFVEEARTDALRPRRGPMRSRAVRAVFPPQQNDVDGDSCVSSPEGFATSTYFAWERDYKVEAHLRWEAELGRSQFRALLQTRRFDEIASRAIRIESRTNLLFSFEKMAMRDAVRMDDGSRALSEGLYDFLHGRGSVETRFDRWCAIVGSLPRRQTRVLTWPVVTVFGFIAQPDQHIFLKPNVTRVRGSAVRFRLSLQLSPSWDPTANFSNSHLWFAGIYATSDHVT
jgi:hypothetical protein